MNLKRNLWIMFLLLFWFDVPIISGRMLKVTDCSLYDAEFSVLHRDMRFPQGIYSPVLYETNLKQCLTKCVLDTSCLSVNYLKSNGTCEFVDVDLYRIALPITDHMFEEAPGWVHFNTKDKNAVGIAFFTGKKVWQI